MDINKILSETGLIGKTDFMEYNEDELNDIISNIILSMEADSDIHYAEEVSDGKYKVNVNDESFELSVWDTPEYLIEEIGNILNITID